MCFMNCVQLVLNTVCVYDCVKDRLVSMTLQVFETFAGPLAGQPSSLSGKYNFACGGAGY